MATEDQFGSLERVIHEEQTEISAARIRTSATLAKEKIYEQMVSASKRRAAALEEEEEIIGLSIWKLTCILGDHFSCTESRI